MTRAAFRWSRLSTDTANAPAIVLQTEMRKPYELLEKAEEVMNSNTDACTEPSTVRNGTHRCTAAGRLVVRAGGRAGERTGERGW